jgi:hypothetical protein
MCETLPAVSRVAVDGILGCTVHSPYPLLGHGVTMAENYYCISVQHLKETVLMNHPIPYQVILLHNIIYFLTA